MKIVDGEGVLIRGASDSKTLLTRVDEEEVAHLRLES